MKKYVKIIMSLTCMAVVFLQLFVPAFAASTEKCYTISSGNTPVYSNTSLTAKYGTIYGSDEITVLSYTGNYAKVTYPISGGTKTGYISRSAILTATSGNSYTSKAKVTTYKRPGGESYGYVAAGDKVIKLGTKNGYVQIKYPVSSGYKYAWVTSAGWNSIEGKSSPWQYPMTNAYVCGNDWLEYYSKRPERPYHLGLDLASRSGDSNVYAAASGTVAAVGTNSANGKYVVISHVVSGKTVYSFYCHLSSYCVSKNTTVSAGTKIGVYGNTGSASAGTHLHFAVANTLKSDGSYYGYGTQGSGNSSTYNGVTYYNPKYVIQYNKLP